jgi:hypothetical protein
MPLHKNKDGSTVSIQWPPPKESGVQIQSRLVTTKTIPKKEAKKVDEKTGWALSEQVVGQHQKALFGKVGEDPNENVIIDEEDFQSSGASSGGWFGGLVVDKAAAAEQEERDRVSSHLFSYIF